MLSQTSSLVNGNYVDLVRQGSKLDNLILRFKMSILPKSYRSYTWILWGIYRLKVLEERYMHMFVLKKDIYICLRYAWVDFLKEKSETFEIFKRLSLKIQNEKSLKVERIRSDHGREFENISFQTLCEKKKRIHHEFSSPKTP